MKTSVIIPAAGQGKRMKADKNKQFLILKERPILAHTINVFDQSQLIDEIIVVAKAAELEYCQKGIVEKYNFKKVSKVVKGGSTRQESVTSGLQNIAKDSDYVLVHDGARPLLTVEIIERTIEQVRRFRSVAVGVPVKDTIKVIDRDQFINDTPKRSKLIAIQTPQAFAKELIVSAYKQADQDKFIGTDSSSLVERLNYKVKVVEGSYENLKITTPEDLELATRILARRK